MTTEQLLARGLRTTNLKIQLYKNIRTLKQDKEYASMSAVIEALYNFYMKKNKKLARKNDEST